MKTYLKHFGIAGICLITFARCGLLKPAENSQESEESKEKSTISVLDQNGFALENYNEANWGFRLSTDVISIYDRDAMVAESVGAKQPEAAPSSAPSVEGATPVPSTAEDGLSEPSSCCG